MMWSAAPEVAQRLEHLPVVPVAQLRTLGDDRDDHRTRRRSRLVMPWLASMMPSSRYTALPGIAKTRSTAFWMRAGSVV